MNAKVRKGQDLLFSSGCSNSWDNLTDTMIVNFKHKWTFKNFRQVDNHLLVTTEEGLIDIVFTGFVPKVLISTYEKDQLVLKLVV
jgi:hypothetical protein